jgi:hypothetical protein
LFEEMSTLLQYVSVSMDKRTAVLDGGGYGVYFSDEEDKLVNFTLQEYIFMLISV